MPAELSFDCVIADPPYNHGIWRNEPVADYAAWCEEWLLECMARLREGGLLYCYGWPEYLAHVAVRFPVKKQRWLQWIATDRTAPTSQFYQRSHESILCLWHGSGLPKLQIDQVREPYETYVKNGELRLKQVAGTGRSSVRQPFYQHPSGRLPRDILAFPTTKGCEHPTQKPALLTKQLLRAVLPDDEPGDVLIPFAGSGSECMVAQSMGHRYLGIELDEQWVRLARETLAATEPML